MFNKIKNSLVFQTNFLLLLSIIFIAILWIFFYISQKHQQEEHNIARYFNTVTTIQPLIEKSIKIKNENLKILGMKLFNTTYLNNSTIIFEKGNKQKGFKLLKVEDRNILHIYNYKGEVYLEDIHKDQTMFLIHIVFLFLLIFQSTLLLNLSSALNPLSILSKKLKKLQHGDLTSLEIKSNYDEINQITKSYNNSISKIDYMLETKEMFNKIFMHEMKMPLAKGMFYLKMTPSEQSHKKLQTILSTINEELNEFSQIESLIAYKNKIDTSENSFLEILDIAINRALVKKEQISLINCENKTLIGDKEFWVLCIKNLIDNAIKYSYDNKLIIDCTNGFLFRNIGDPLPVDISKDIKKWKIDKTKRHQSSTGYGFGLFIIKNIVLLHNYKLSYNYNSEEKVVELRIF